MKKGVVMEIRKRHIIVMTKDGEFCRAKPDEHAHIGEEVEFSPAPLYSFSCIMNRKMYSVPLAFFVVMMFVIPFLSVIQPGKVYGVVSLDMDPSIELAVNDNYEIVSASGYNEKGRTFLNELDKSFEGMSLVSAATLLIKEGYRQDSFDSTNTVLISSSLSFQKEDNWGEEFETWSEKLSGEYDFDIYSVTVGTEIAEKAQEASLSPAKLLLLSYFNAGGLESSQVINLPLQELKDIFGGAVEDLIEAIHISSHAENEEADEPNNNHGTEKGICKSDEEAA